MTLTFSKQVSVRIAERIVKTASVRIGILALSALVTGCYGDGGGYNAAFEGMVVEEGTGKPVAGAFVIAKWTHNGGNPVGTNTTCPHVEVVMTDANGRYKIPAIFISSFFGTYRKVYAFKTGLEDVTALNQNESWRSLRMAPFKGTAEERLASYDRYGYLEGCGKAEEYTPKLIPLYRAIHEEAKALGVTSSKEKELEGSLKFFKEFGDESKDWWKPNYGKPLSKGSPK